MVRGIGENGHEIFFYINKVSNGLTVAKAEQVLDLSILEDSLVDFKNNVFVVYLPINVLELPVPRK